jgi:hypothetical protein
MFVILGTKIGGCTGFDFFRVTVALAFFVSQSIKFVSDGWLFWAVVSISWFIVYSFLALLWFWGLFFTYLFR